MEQFFQWFFDGLGTFLVGLVVGGGASSVITYRLAKKTNQKAKATKDSTIVQIGGDYNNGSKS